MSAPSARGQAPTAETRFDGKVVLVTGDSRGIGERIAEAFFAEGATVHVGYRRREQDAARAIRAAREARPDRSAHQIKPWRVDVSDPLDVERAIRAVIDEHGRIDVLVNNAGVLADAPLVASAEEDWADLLAVNLQGATRCMRAALRAMIAQRAGVVVNIGSVAALRASPGQAAYAASKAGLLALTRTAAAEVASYGVRVNAVVPGLIRAGMVTRMDRRALDRALAHVPAGRLGTAEEVASVVLFLASDAARYIIGQSLVVDGGLSL